MTFNLFGPPTKDDIRVGYIDPDLGFVENATIGEANEYAIKNPGTTFVFRNGNNVVQYLNINEVNQLDPNSLISTDKCEGINQKKECGPPTIQMFGGGGIGAAGNPIIGRDGSLLAVDVVRGGNGYQYPPLVAARDNCNYGTGATLTAVLGEVTETIETYENESDFEDYEIPEDTEVGYGRRYGPDGEDLGEWEPRLYTDPGEDPIRKEVEEYEKIVRRLARVPFWTTRSAKPTKISCSDTRVIPQKYDVTFPAWNEFMNAYAISPVAPSNVKGSDFSGRLFTFEWTEDFPLDGEYTFRGLCDNVAQLYVDNLKVTDLKGFNDSVTPITKSITKGIHNIRIDLLNVPILQTKVLPVSPTEVDFTVFGKGAFKDLSFIFTSEDGKDSFTIDGAKKSNQTRNEKRKIRPNVNYKVVAKEDSKKYRLLEQGLIQKNKKNKEGPEGTSTKIFADYVSSGNDNDDIQITAGSGIFTSSNRRKVKARTTFDLTYRLDQSTSSSNSSSKNSTSSNLQVRKVFNTLDYIGKANRTLWRNNPTASSGDSLISQFGISPFDTTTKQAQTNSFAGTHTIIWDNVNFPVDGSYRIKIAVDDNVKLFIGDKQITHRGFVDISKANKDFNESRTFKAGKYTIRAELEQIKGKPLAKGNPMALAIDIEITTTEQVVVSPKSWNQNPMGISVTIDAPDPAVPKEPAPIQEGRCPPNPIWTTRFPDAKETWYPVKFNGSKSPQGKKEPWAKFFNRYAISPVRPLDTPGSDAGGILFTNSWEIDIPYDGFYKFAAQRDDTARIYVDGNLAFDIKTSGDDIWRDFRNKPKFQKVFISKGRHTIGIELENNKTETFSQISQKIFRTKDWQVSPVSQEYVNVDFVVYRQGGNSSTVPASFTFTSEDGKDSFTIVRPNIDRGTRNDKIKVRSNINYKVVANNSGRTGDSRLEQGLIKSGTQKRETGPGTSNKIFADFIGSSNDNDDLQITALNGTFTSSNKRSVGKRSTFDLVFKVDSSSSKSTSGQLTSGTTVDGVTYQGPTLFHYRDNRWGEFMNNHSLSPVIPGKDGDSKRKSFTWKNVKFPENGQYDITFLADNDARLIIGGVEVLRAQGFGDNPQTFKVNITEGTYDLVVDSEYPYTTSRTNTAQYFKEKNPTGFGIVIRKNVNVRNDYGKSWDENPMGIGAILIPPPCPKIIRGRGVVTDVIVNDPGNGYLRPIPQQQGYPVALRLKEVIVENPGINYSGDEQFDMSNGAELQPVFGPFGKVESVTVLNPGLGFTEYPEIRLISETGVNASFRPVFEVVRDPIVLPERLIQVTDLVGLKQTGYVDGRPYYGSVYYDQGVRYAGFYETVGDPVRIYDTLQESITAKVTTPASAIQRQGTDITNNDPRLNIPGTPENLI
jgi:hypothetical protein